jgi:hypothetical protein
MRWGNNTEVQLFRLSHLQLRRESVPLSPRAFGSLISNHQDQLRDTSSTFVPSLVARGFSTLEAGGCRDNYT